MASEGVISKMKNAAAIGFWQLVVLFTILFAFFIALLMWRGFVALGG